LKSVDGTKVELNY